MITAIVIVLWIAWSLLCGIAERLFAAEKSN